MSNRSEAEARALFARNATVAFREDDIRDLHCAVASNAPFSKYYTSMNMFMAYTLLLEEYPHLQQFIGGCVLQMERHAADRGQNFLGMEQNDALGRMRKAYEKFVEALKENKFWVALGHFVNMVNWGAIALLPSGVLDSPPSRRKHFNVFKRLAELEAEIARLTELLVKK